MRIKLLWLGVLVSIFTFNSCVKKTFNQEVVIPAIDSLNITASVYGRIIDEAGIPIAGAKVKGPINTTTTNVNGEFTFTNISLNDYGAQISASYPGYFDGARTFIARQGQKHYIEIQLMKKSADGILSSTTGGTITLTNGASLLLPANALKNQSTGVVYNGDVHVALTYIDPTATNSGKQIPGALRGFNTAGLEKGLESYGMIGIEITDNAGNILQLDSFKTAILNFPIPTSIKKYAPSNTIALWSFNASSGFWEQEGSATYNGNNYSATITHFSFWGCHDTYNGVRFSATIIDQNNNPMKKTLVRILRVLNNTYTYSFTDTTGFVAGLVPKNEPLVLDVMGTGSCSDNIIYFGNVGPFSSATATAGVIPINNLGTYGNATISGTVTNCSNQLVSQGLLYINLKGLSYQATITNGSYKLSIPMCVSSDTISYFAIDKSSSFISNRANAVIYTGNNKLSNISVCGNSANGFIYYAIDKDTVTSNDSINTPIDSTSAYLVGNISPNFTTISGYKSSRSISFNFTGVTGGSYTMNNLYINHPYLMSDNSLDAQNVTVSISNYAYYIGGYITGSFSGTFVSMPSNTTHTLNGIFKVRRDY